VAHRLQLLEGDEQLLGPEGGALAHGDQAGRLVMGAAQRGRAFVRRGELGQPVQADGHFGQQQVQRVAHLNQVRVVLHEGRRGAQVQDAARVRAHVLESSSKVSRFKKIQ